MLEYLRQLGESSSDSLDKGTGKSAEGWLIARGGKDIPFPAQPTSAATESSASTPHAPNFYTKRSTEGLVLPSADQLMASATLELKRAFRRDLEVPQPPAELFETLQNFAERGITKFDETYYLPGLRLTQDDQLWKGRGKVKPGNYFWQHIENGNFPSDVTVLEEGWYIGDKRGKPMYQNGQQRYGEDDYMEPLMAHLRTSNRIQKYSRVPNYSRFGASPEEIEGVILPTFAEMSEARGIVRNRRYIEFNVRGNMVHPEWGQTNIWEWFGDPVFAGAYRLFGGDSDGGGLADVHDSSVGDRNDVTGFSPVVYFPSKPR